MTLNRFLCTAAFSTFAALATFSAGAQDITSASEVGVESSHSAADTDREFPSLATSTSRTRK